jgi:hypothetical protein
MVISTSFSASILFITFICLHDWIVDIDRINYSIIVINGAFSLIDIGKGIVDFGSLL